VSDYSPITPPPELVQQWINEEDGLTAGHIATQAARWGADMELEACCELVPGLTNYLRDARRPKPPSLNEVALQMLGTIERDAHYIPEITDTIRRALEALPND
jgi:hypothetical protein